MICRPRAGTRPGGTYRSRIAIHRSPPDARGRRSFVSGEILRRAPRTGVGDAVRGGEVGGGKENGGRPPPFPGAAPRPDRWPSSVRSRADGRRSAGGWGNRESAASPLRSPVGRQPPGFHRYTRRVPGCHVEVARGRGARGRSCDRAIRARRPSREAAERPAEPSPSLRRRPAGDLQPDPGRGPGSFDSGPDVG